jgi:integrase
MPRKRTPLTKSLITKAVVPPGAKELRLWDSIVPGLRVRCLLGGSKTFEYRYRPQPGGRRVHPRVLTIGDYPALSLADARDAARIHVGEVAKGKDPARERAEKRRRQRAVLGKLLAPDGPYQKYLERRGLINVRTAMHALRRGLQAHMSSDVKDLTRADVVGAINALTLGSAADLRKFARGFLEWSVAHGLTEFNVMAGLHMPGRTRAQKLLLEPKGKALSDGEIVAVWRAAQALVDRAARGEAVSGSFGGLVQLALLTGLRRGELSQLERDRHILTGERAIAVRGIDGERIHLPKTITKTVADHDIALTPLMRTVIAAQPRTTSALLFPSRITGGRLKNWADLVMGLQRYSGVDFRLHDLRRTTRTLMSRLGVSEDVSEMAIGHQREALILKYNKDPMWPQRTEAFARVSQHIASLLVDTGDDRSNVVALQTTGRLKQ